MIKQDFKVFGVKSSAIDLIMVTLNCLEMGLNIIEQDSSKIHVIMGLPCLLWRSLNTLWLKNASNSQRTKKNKKTIYITKLQSYSYQTLISARTKKSPPLIKNLREHLKNIAQASHTTYFNLRWGYFKAWGRMREVLIRSKSPVRM